MHTYVRWIALAGLLAAFLALASGCAGDKTAGSGKSSAGGQGTPVSGARISIPDDSFDFGKVPLDKIVSRAFKIKNVGSAPLVLLGQPTVRAVQGC